MGTLFFHNRIVAVLSKYSLQLVDNAMLVVGKGASYVASLTQWVEISTKDCRQFMIVDVYLQEGVGLMSKNCLLLSTFPILCPCT